MVRTSCVAVPGLTLIAEEQVVCVPSEAPIATAFVFNRVTAANGATPLAKVNGFEVAVTAPGTKVVQPLSE